MNKSRMESLSDGVFSIVMTLLVFELMVPTREVIIADFGEVTNTTIWLWISSLGGLFTAYILSFLVLFYYWTSHNFLLSTFAQNLDTNLNRLNGLFLLTVALVPFSSQFLGAYNDLTIGVVIYSVNVLIIGLLLTAMARYVIQSTVIENTPEFRKIIKTPRGIRNVYLRSSLPPMAAVVAIGFSFWNTWLAIILLIIAVVFNLIPGGIDTIEKRIFGRFFEG